MFSRRILANEIGPPTGWNVFCIQPKMEDAAVTVKMTTIARLESHDDSTFHLLLLGRFAMFTTAAHALDFDSEPIGLDVGVARPAQLSHFLPVPSQNIRVPPPDA